MEYLNSIYYTFSTIAQVLSGFIALSGVFVLFKLQELKEMQFIHVQFILKAMKEGYGSSSISSYPPIANNLHIFNETKTTVGMIKEIDEIISKCELDSLKKMIEGWKPFIEKIVITKNKVRKLTIVSLILGVITIAYSLIILSFTHFFSKNCALTITYIGIVLALTTIVFMVSAILISLKEFSPYKPIVYS